MQRLRTRFPLLLIRLVNRFTGAHIQSRWKAILARWLENLSGVPYRSTERAHGPGSSALTHNPLSRQHNLLQASCNISSPYNFGLACLSSTARTRVTFSGSTQHPKKRSSIRSPEEIRKEQEHAKFSVLKSSSELNPFRKLEFSTIPSQPSECG